MGRKKNSSDVVSPDPVPAETSTTAVARPRRSVEQVKMDRAEMARLKRRGWSDEMISEHFGLDVKVVVADLNVVLKTVAKDLKEDGKILLQQKLEELAECKRELWSEWERSKLPAKRKTTESSTTARGSTEKESETEEERLGDPRYVNSIIECIKKECELRGLNPDKRLEVSGSLQSWDMLAGNVEAASVVEDDIRRAVDELMRLSERPQETIYVDAEKREERDDRTGMADE